LGDGGGATGERARCGAVAASGIDGILTRPFDEGRIGLNRGAVGTEDGHSCPSPSFAGAGQECPASVVKIASPHLRLHRSTGRNCIHLAGAQLLRDRLAVEIDADDDEFLATVADFGVAGFTDHFGDFEQRPPFLFF